MLQKMIPMREAKERLPSLVREAACGARLVITVHGKPLADLVPHQEIHEAPRPSRPAPVRVKLSPGKSLDSVLNELRDDR